MGVGNVVDQDRLSVDGGAAHRQVTYCSSVQELQVLFMADECGQERHEC